MKLAAVLAFALAAGSAQAAVVKLENVNDTSRSGHYTGHYYPSHYYRAGILSNSDLIYYYQSGFIYREIINGEFSDDSGWVYDTFFFRDDGKRFSLLNAFGSAGWGGRLEQTGDTPPPVRSDFLDKSAFDDSFYSWATSGRGTDPAPHSISLLWQGYRDGTLVASWVQPEEGHLPVFGVEFADLDLVTVGLWSSGGYRYYYDGDFDGSPYYNYDSFTSMLPNTYWCYEYCQSGFVRSVTFDVIEPPVSPPAPVPLPPSLPLLVAGVGTLAFAGRQRRQS